MENRKSENALDIWYVKLLSLFLMPIGGWPNLKKNGDASLFSVHNCNLIIQLVTVIGEVTYLHDIFGIVDFFLVGDVYITTFLTMLSMVRLTLTQFNNYSNIIENYVKKVHLIYFKHKGVEFNKICTTINKISHYFTLCMCTMCISGMVLFNLSPMYVNFKNGAFTSNRHQLNNMTIEFSVRYKYPGFDQRDHFILTTIVNFYLSFICYFSIISIDLLLVLMIFQIVGHLEILSNNMRSLPLPKTSYLTRETNNNTTVLYNKNENSKLNGMLQELIEHHKMIIRTDINFLWSHARCYIHVSLGWLLPITAGMFSWSISEIAVNMEESKSSHFFHGMKKKIVALFMEPDVIVRFGPLTAVIFMQLIQISVTFEIVGHKSEMLIDSVYELPWEYMNVQNQRIVCIMLCRVQRPIRVTAFGLAGVGVRTMANILKTTFSYYTFLQSL